MLKEVHRVTEFTVGLFGWGKKEAYGRPSVNQFRNKCISTNCQHGNLSLKSLMEKKKNGKCVKKKIPNPF